MKVGFAGTPAFAAHLLHALIDAEIQVALALTQPDRPRGRGQKQTPSPVKELARQHAIPVHQPSSLATVEAQSLLLAHELDVLVVAAYGLLLPAPILQWPRHGCINVHASLLPRWRGAAPIQRAILAGDEISGITLMRMDEGLDTGPMLARQTLDIRGRNAQVTEDMASLGARMLIEWLDAPTPPEPQPVAGATYAKKIDKAEARIDWSKPAVDIERQVRAFAPAPGAWFDANGERIKLLEASVGTDASGAPGEVLDDSLNIAAADGYVRPLKVQRAGRAPMAPGDLLRGFAIPKGTILP